jgi:nucleotide-binding universal stress UspA family protein
MQTSSLKQKPADPIDSPLTSKVLRQWCAPEVILVVTNLADESTLLFHAIRQARQGSARILLVHVVRPARLWPILCRGSLQARRAAPIRDAQAEVDRMARQFRWVGIHCDSFVLQGLPSEEIPAFAKFCCADRVIVTTQGDENHRNSEELTVAEQILPVLEVPACVIGRGVPAPSHTQRMSARLTLPLSLRRNSEIPLRFACRFAQELRTGLTVMHVFPRDPEATQEIDRTPIAVASRLPAWALREAELLCPLEVAVREGEPATEILKHDSCVNQDFIILSSSGSTNRPHDEAGGITHRVLSEAHCPVIVLPRKPVEPSQPLPPLSMFPISSNGHSWMG